VNCSIVCTEKGVHFVELVLFGILAGIDNVAVASALGAAGLRRDGRIRLASAFFAFEALMPFAGLLMGQQLRASVAPIAAVLGPSCLAVCGLLVLGAALRRTSACKLINRPWLMVMLPLVLSLDNLAAGAGFGFMDLPVVPAAIVVGGVSGAIAIVGLALGERARSWSVRPAEMIAGGLLVTVAVVSVLRDFA
jgi:putative Mn2+ efflux pump MntP